MTMNLQTLAPGADVDFLNLGADQFILRCEVPRPLQRRYDDAVKSQNKDALAAVVATIREMFAAEVIKAEQLPDLRKRRDELAASTDAFLRKAGNSRAAAAQFRSGPDHFGQPTDAAQLAMQHSRGLPLTKNVQPLVTAIALTTTEGEMLFLKSAAEQTWSLPTEPLFADEVSEQAVVRAAWEQLRYRLPPGDRRQIITAGGEEPFSVWLQRIPEKFKPRLTAAHVEHKWSPPDAHPQPLSPNLRTVMAAVNSEATQFTMR
jgi:hypothetical protein